jgi:hypothetical protein
MTKIIPVTALLLALLIAPAQAQTAGEMLSWCSGKGDHQRQCLVTANDGERDVLGCVHGAAAIVSVLR